MTQLEIATQIFCSGKNYTIDESLLLAAELIELEKKQHRQYPLTPDDVYKPLQPLLDTEALEERTRKRTQQLFDLGFEWIEDKSFFELKGNTCNPYSIEQMNNTLWDSFIFDVKIGNEYLNENTEQLEEDLVPQEELLTLPINEIETKASDLFKGKDFIDFQMEKSICRLYLIDNKLKAEDELQVTKKLESKFIMASSENEEFNLGITIFKK